METNVANDGAIRVAFSPDSDDIFMFYALLNGKLDTGHLKFVYERMDTESLNQRAGLGDVDVIALSIARYATVAKDYLLLPHGFSVGRGYGPVLVANIEGSLIDFSKRRIGVPGLHTTAYFTLRLVLPDFEPVVLPISPYRAVFDALREDRVDAAVLIHEGRLTYAREGFAKVAELGEAWANITGGLPLPLGGNAIRRSLGAERIAAVSRLCQASIAFALANRGEVMDALLLEDARGDLRLDRALLDRYLDMYANDDTLHLAEDTRRAILELYRRARTAGLLAQDVVVEFAP